MGCREVYDCTFQHMISAWRDGWFYATNGATDPNFPFGFVQLGPNSAQGGSCFYHRVNTNILTFSSMLTFI